MEANYKTEVLIPMIGKLNPVLIGALGMVLLFAGMAFGKTKSIDVMYPALVGNSLKLAPGKYNINVNQHLNRSEVQFYNKNGNLVGQVPAKVVSRSRKNSQTEIFYDKLASNRQDLTKISPQGWRQSLIFRHQKAASE